MRIVVNGGSGFIGSKLVNRLRQLDHEVMAVSPASGANILTEERLAEMLSGAQVVVDVVNPPSTGDREAFDFFQSSGDNLLKAEAVAGIKHHVILSLVGLHRMQGSAFINAKIAQQEQVKASKIPYTIAQSTQFFEWVRGIARAGTIDREVHISPAHVQPVASDNVASALTEISLSEPLNVTVEIAGPERLQLDELLRIFLNGTDDPRHVITDKHALFLGTELNDQTLLPSENARIGKTRFIEWMNSQTK